MRMDSATPHSAGAQNDSMVGDVQGTFQDEGRIQSCSFEADSSQLSLTVFAPHKQVVKVSILALFPSHFARVSNLTHESNIYS